jgi:O-antigen biosynthesis protein
LQTAFARADERLFFGFVVDRGDLTEKFSVEIMADGSPVRVLRADGYVHELAQEGVGDGCYGFSLSLDDGLLSEACFVEARLANLGTPVGVPISLESVSDPVPRPSGPGGVRWLGGLRFAGWMVASAGIAGVDVFVDGTLIRRVQAFGWSHLGVGNDARAVPAFDFHLPERFADGRAHQLTMIQETGERLNGCPLVFLAFADGIRETLFRCGGWGRRN